MSATVALTVADIFDGRGSLRADSKTVVEQIGFWVRAELGLHSAVTDEEDGYVKFKMGGRRSHWLWVRLNPLDLYDIRITKYDRKQMGHLPVSGRDDIYADQLGEAIRALATTEGA